MSHRIPGVTMVFAAVVLCAVPLEATDGLLQFVVEYEDVRSFIRTPGKPSEGPAPDEVRLTVEEVRLSRVAEGGPAERRRVLTPAGRDAAVLVKRGRHYVPLLRGLPIPAGTYEDLEVRFRDGGEAVLGNQIHPVRLHGRNVKYDGRFELAAGKITTLHAVPKHEPGSELGADRLESRNDRFFHVWLDFKTASSVQWAPIERLFLRMTSLSAVGPATEVLNDTPAEIELLSLRNGAAALMGQNRVPAGTYRRFDMALAGKGRVEWGDQKADIIIDHDANDVLRFEGPFDLRGGRITEVFLHFDPSTSVFLTRGFGYVMDPEVTAASVISMTPEQDLRLVEALGPRGNLVEDESELIVEATVTSVETVAGQTMIYSDATLRVDDRLRGQIADPDAFALRLPGGERNGLRLRVDHMPTLAEGERCLLFLRKVGDRYAPVRGDWGKLPLPAASVPPGFVPAGPKWPGQYPVVSFRLNPDIRGPHIGDALAVADAVRLASSLWSSGNLQARFDIQLQGTTGERTVHSPAGLDCSDVASAPNLVFAQPAPDPDCTAAACTFEWTCGADPLHFDVQLNNADFAFSTGTAPDAGEYDLATVVAHALGHAAGLGHCEPGESPAQCGRSGMHALYGPLSAGELALRQEMGRFSAVVDGLCAAGGCLLPREETDARYQLLPSEIAEKQEHDAILLQDGFGDRDKRLSMALHFSMLYHTAYRANETPAERYLLDSVERRAEIVADMDTDYLNASRHVISVNIDTLDSALSELQTDLDADYLGFARTELKALVLIRKAIIDEQNRRGEI